MFGFLFLAIIIEGIISYSKEFFVNGNFKWQMLVSIAIGVLAAVAFNLDIFAQMGMVSRIPFVGCVLTGILVSRGSNYIFDLIKRVGLLKDGTGTGTGTGI